MKPSIGYCQDVLKTLPVGYYLGHPVSLRLDPAGDATYIEMDCERVTVSYNNICAALKHAPENIGIESVIRSLLYHEISHALLTPSELVNNRYDRSKSEFINHFTDNNTRTFVGINKAMYIYPRLRDIINIFEDERIETLCSTYYMNVDFKRLVVLLNGDPKTFKDRDPMGKFFALVRYRIGPAALVARVGDIIAKHAEMTHDMDSGSLAYIDKIVTLFAKCIPDDISNPSNSPMQSAQDNSPMQDAQDTDTVQDAQDNDQLPDMTDAQIEAQLQAIMKTLKKAACIDMSNTRLKDVFKAESTNRDAAAARAQLDKIIRTALNREKSRSNGSYGYAGRIDPRATQNKDYKWFAKKSQGSTVKRFDKVQFNLFCDNSGSFARSRLKMNAVITALKDLAATNPDVQVTVVKCGHGVTVPDQDAPWLECHFGSMLDKNLLSIYKNAQKPGATNINMVVFDGEFIVGDDITEAEAFGTFNHPNCIIVSDTDNQDAFEQFAPQARKTFIEGRYAETFISQLLDQVGRMLA